MDENTYFNNNYYLSMDFENKPFNTLNESFTTTISEISNTMTEVSDTSKISDMISETSNSFDIIDETSNAFSSSWSDIWKFFDKEKKEKTVIARCKCCPNVKYSVIKGATTNLWTHIRRVHPSLLGTPPSQRTLDHYRSNNNDNKISEVTQDDLWSWIMEWIVRKDLSFTIVEGRIKSIIERISKFHVVSADTIKCDIIKKYKEMLTNVQIELQEVPGKFDNCG
ncbi:hypothetical protein C2G38_2028515 [Gigaspora rosea]|uniref:BED-type domain-containing protein n=1 Tax=Gigaspora rosea TaxID=44941 RepID=A0A397W4G6_9GLOM|nr:hypothetical protein C2G38_2028514 [Gigaspora rosea]RIB28448.1 hypothetical protein C2G38_2028515 [Gigaspora rosea]